MMRKMLQIGDSFLASVESIKVIIPADAAKVKNYMEITALNLIHRYFLIRQVKVKYVL